MGRVACIDFGCARLGLAISDENRIISQPIKAVPSGKDFKETALLIAQELSKYSKVELIVLGFPLLLSGKEGEMAAKVRAFKAALEQILPLPICLWDERLTSCQVERLLKDSNVRRKDRRKLSDALSAATILQSYLASQC